MSLKNLKFKLLIKLNHKIYTVQVHACAGGRVLGLIFAGYMLQASQSPYPFTVKPQLSGLFLWSQFGRDPNLVTFCVYEVTHFLDWMKNTLLFICSTNILVSLLTINMKNCPTTENLKMCNPILVTLSKVQSHYRQSSRENVTPSSGTSPLASYKEVPTPWDACWHKFFCCLRFFSPFINFSQFISDEAPKKDQTSCSKISQNAERYSIIFSLYLSDYNNYRNFRKLLNY